MDWVIEAAKRKTQRPPGSSRSIVESLNVFNEIVSEGQSELSSILNDADTWMKKEDVATNVGNNKESRYGQETSSLVSPEKTDSTFAMDFKERSFSEKAEKESPSPSDRNETPMRTGEALPSTTPKSLAGDNFTEDLQKSELERTVTENHVDVEKEKRPVWSPYRNEATLRETVETGSVPHNKASELQAYTSTALGNNASTKTTQINENTSPESNKLHRVARDRSQRRSNMFVPLPSKGPLVVHHTIPENSASEKSSIPIYGVTAQNKPSKILDKRRSLNFQDTPSDSVKLTSSTRKTRSPAYDTGVASMTSIPKFTTSVFDRLSSLPTKSFENKITTKTGERKISSSSSIDVTGSPMRRTSLSFRSSVVTDASIQETLKNIFSSKNNTVGATKSQTVNNSHSGKVFKKGLAPKAKNNNLKGLEPSKTGIELHDNNVIKTLSENEDAPDKMVSSTAESTNHILDSKSELLAGNIVGGMQSKGSRSNNKGNLNQVDQNHSNWNPRSIQSLLGIEQTNAPLGGELQNKSRNHDRLTKFQLLPPVESEKDDLKRKLSKRLSEVMRTQQNQQRRRHEHQKRKSHLEEDFKRRTRLWNEVKEVPLAAPLGPKAINNDPSPQRFEQNTILHDLNSVDHRNYIGGDSNLNDSQLDNENEPGNRTLPEINSDSEDEKDSTLPPWAKSPYLQDQLYLQQNWDPKKIFGALPPLHIDEIFQISRLNRLKSRQSTTKRT